MTKLTNLQAKNITPDSKLLKHGLITGLTLHPSSSKGKGKWVLRYVSPVTSKRRKAGLGSFPEVSIAQAAKVATEMRELIAQGKDPLIEKELEQTKPVTPNFEEAAKTLHAELLPGWKNAKHGQQWINTLTQYAFPSIGALPLMDIQPAHIADVLRPIWLEKPETAGRVKQRIKAVMDWAWAHGYCEGNPVTVVKHLLPAQPSKNERKQHQPAMAWQDIPEFVQNNLHQASAYSSNIKLLEFLILTASRSGEARDMRWEEVDWEQAIWTIPATRMKNKRLHRVPLSQRAIEILRH